MGSTTSQRWTVRKKSPTASELKALAATIKAVAPKADKEDREVALKELQQAIEHFRLHYPYTGKGKKRRGKIAEKRESLSNLAVSLRKSLAAVRALPLDAKRSFSQRIGAPAGKLTKLLSEWETAAAEEYLQATKAADREADHAPGVLAFDVARILSNTLCGKVPMTSDRNTAGYIRGGAGYCRLLRVTLQAAGATPPVDLMPIMREGKALFDEFSTIGE